MHMQHGFIAHPWILELVDSDEHPETEPKAVPAHVLEFVKSSKNQFDNMLDPAAVVRISDGIYYIPAVITIEAKKKMEEEEEHFTFEDIKDKIIILNEFRVLFTQANELKNCEFYIRIETFRILPMETDRNYDIMNCNDDPAVKWRIKEHWKKYIDEFEMQARGSSDGPLTQLLIISNEEKFAALKNSAHKCLNLKGRMRPLPSARLSTEALKTGIKSNKTNSRVFSVPVKWLIISPEEEEALNNLEEWRDDYHVTNDDVESESCLDDVIATKPSNTPESPTSSDTSQAHHVVLRTVEDGEAHPDSSTPDLMEHAEGTLQDKMNSTPVSLFSDSSKSDQEDFENTDAIMCETVTSIGNTCGIDSAVACGQKPNNVKNDTISQLQEPCCLTSDISCIFDLSFPKDASQNQTVASEHEKIISQIACSVVANDSMETSDSDIIRSEDEEEINETCIEQQATTQPVEPITKTTTVIEERKRAGMQSYAEKPKRKGSPLHEQHSMKIRAMAYKPKLQFLNERIKAAQEVHTTSSALLKGIHSKSVVNSQEKQKKSLQEKEQGRYADAPNQQRANNLKHFDGSRLQYTYKTAGSDLRTRVRSAKLSEELLEWASNVVFQSKQERL